MDAGADLLGHVLLNVTCDLAKPSSTWANIGEDESAPKVVRPLKDDIQ